ncbi:MAG TPA: HWE histidine kinase domain-containing protein [Caulobacteraceae bacterium]
MNAPVAELTELEALRRRAAESERRLQAILDNATVAVLLMNERQQCVYMNAAAEQLTGYQLQETLDRTLHEVIHHTRPDGSPFPIAECAIDRAFPENHRQQGEEVFVHKSGRFYPVAFTASPVRDEAGVTIGTVVEVRDITKERRDDDTRRLLMREVDHRARNALAVVQSLVRLTKAADIETYQTALLGRINALARAQGNLAERRWEGASLREIICDELRALCPKECFSIDGPDATLQPDHAQPTSMIIHELATNAFKHGALSTPDGHVDVAWTVADGAVEIEWRERGGPPVKEPERRGFGSKLIQQLCQQAGATVSKTWDPAGLRAYIRLPAH